MLALALVAFVLAVVARLVVVVRRDRPSSPPRSHFHETDPWARFPVR